MYLEIDRSGAVTLKKQVYDRIIQRILDGTLSGGEKMPSSRYLSEKLKVSRNIILEAYEQLIAEGYLEAVTGSGTFVAGDLVLPPEKRRTTPQEIPIDEELSFTHQKGIIDFISGIPDLTDFPCRNWIQCQRTVERYSDPTIWDLGEIRGQYSLRSEIARYLERRNGIHVSPGQIFITSGVSQAVLLASLFIRKKRSGVLVENPVVWFVPEVFRET
ncbi:MAG: aminotransferase class I/II-fold pyridoxal phosphate-dependent enzyme, partial [Spirochaetota bacterium]